MKKILLYLLMTVSFCNAFAQTEKRNWMVGGSITLNTSDNTTTIGIDPTAAYFAANNLALGGNLTLNYAKLGENKATTFGFGPLIRYYFGKSSIRPFLHGDFGVVSEQFKFPNNSNTESGINYTLAFGLAGFLNQNVALETMVGYDHTKLKDSEGDGGFLFRVGFQVYLHPRSAIEQIKTGQQ